MTGAIGLDLSEILWFLMHGVIPLVIWVLWTNYQNDKPELTTHQRLMQEAKNRKVL
jgi:hypothetical protein